MATAKDIDAPLTLEMSGGDVSPSSFVRSVRAFFDAVKILTEDIDSSVHWRVQVKQGSNLISAIPKAGYDIKSVHEIVASFDRGFGVLESAQTDAGDFPEEALERLRDLASVAVGADDDVTMKVWTEKKPHILNAHIVAAIDDILTGAFNEYGSVVGRIETISKHGGARFVVYENRNPRAINCIVPEDRIADVIAAFDKRAEVYGLVHYDKHGRPLRVNVDDIDVLLESDDLPTHGEVRGALKGLPN